MRNFTSSKSVDGLPYHRTDYTLLPLPDTRKCFVDAAAEFFVQNWMSSALPQMLNVWQSWNCVADEDKKDYYSYLDHLFFNGSLIDDPSKGYTSPMATFSETMLRWLRQHSTSSPLLVEPEVPQSPDDGKIDFIEITGNRGDYASMKLTMWEVKSSDSQASNHNTKIYSQLRDYPRRFYRMANALATRHKDDGDPVFQLFLRNMTGMVRNRQPQVHYGVFIMYDESVSQKVSLVPHLHKYPKDHPNPSVYVPCHHLALFLVPNFRQMRLDVWQCLHLL